MVAKDRLGLYLKDKEMKRQIKIAAAKRGVPITAYCVEAIEERLIRDGERSSQAREANHDKLAFLTRMSQLRKEVGPLGRPTWELIDEGRRR